MNLRYTIFSVLIIAYLAFNPSAQAPPAPSATYPELIRNLDVTQRTIDQTICIPNYTRSIRPHTSYTNKIKKQLITEFGFINSDLGDFQLDHFLPLELGGHPTDPRNLKLGYYIASPNIRDKDKLAGFLKRKVCAKIITLDEAQKEITEDWIFWFNQYKLK